ncbi:filamentous hemagglutinin N-terminal domain-containing protein [Acaryochloris sp. IP29b_bin.148]|uniref:two-partner secretion domain-containing protein n=1 Tax=Acaryochloris sp. IP29b_bin.148 TaxID=2969218 RepID=UPI0026063A5F|nr:filamentous hemagglutinin N-terminal domain-containing protein [Acaryochloris sp. IP29b_bin.148]
MTSASAQIRPDATLPNNSIARPEGTTTRILGGTQAGSNLFHSFQQFDLPTGATANFDQAPDITNILARVTGGQQSTLDGVIQANGTANLFLINPSGILFGPNAQLNLGGSFLATTANRFLFPDGTVFSATPDPQAAPLLSVRRPVGLAFDAQPGNISVRSQPGLVVQPGQTLSLLGGQVNVEGNLTAPGGRIELGAVGANQQVQFDLSGTRSQITYDTAQQFGDIRIDNLAVVDTSGIGGGDIDVQGRRVTLAEGSRLQSITFGDIDGGAITVKATDSLDLLGNRVTSGPIDPFFARQGFVLPQKTRIVSTTRGMGQASDIRVRTGTLRVTDGADITAATDGLGDGGDLSIDATQSIEVVGETILLDFAPSAIPFTEPVTRNFLIDQTSVSQINARSAFIPNSGASGDITIQTRDLTLRNGASLAAGSNVGPGGSITVKATGTVEIVGSTQSGDSTSNLVTASISNNNALNTVLQANKLILREGGLISASTFGAGQGGTIKINTTESVEISGVSRSGQIESQIDSGTFGPGNSGDIQIETGTFKLQDGASVELSSIAQGQTGSFSLKANSVILENQGRISSNAVASPAGNINIETQRLLLSNGSNITTNALGTEAGGNIRINADLIVALPLEGDSNITANALNGPGGQINITTQGLFGIAVRDRNTPLNDITAISQNNPQLNGVVTLNTPEADPSRNLSEQPEAVEPPQAVSRGCQANRFANRSSFKHSGRGGLPTMPNEDLSSLALWQDLRATRLPDPQALSDAEPLPSRTMEETDTEIVEAKGWTQDTQGRTILTAQQYSPSDQQSWQTASAC